MTKYLINGVVCAVAAAIANYLVPGHEITAVVAGVAFGLIGAAILYLNEFRA